MCSRDDNVDLFVNPLEKQAKRDTEKNCSVSIETTSIQFPKTENTNLPENVNIEDLITIEELQKIQNEFSSATGLSCAIADKNGDIVTSFSNSYRFCRELLENSNDRANTCRTNLLEILKASLNEVGIHQCPLTRLYNYSASIKVGNQFIGFLLVGQIRNEASDFPDFDILSKKSGISKSTLQETFSEIPILPLEQFKRIGNALQCFANLLSSFLYKNYTLRQEFLQHVEQASELREIQERNHTIVESSHDAILIESMDGIILDCNSKACELFQYSRNELIGMHALELIGAKAHAGIPDILNELKLYNSTFIESVGKKKDGSLFPDEVTLTLTVYKKQKSLLVNIRDISERKQTELKLRLSEKHFRHVFMYSPDGIYVRKNRKLLAVNPSFAQIFEYDMNELLNRDFDILDLVSPQDYEKTAKRMYEFDADNSPIPNDTLKAHTKSGVIKDVEIVHARIDWYGEDAVLGFLRDITEQKQLETQVIQAQKMEVVGRMAGGIAHDFNNLLTVITGNSDLALAALDENNPAYRFIHDINQVTERATELTNQLLTFSRKQSIVQLNIDINTIITDLQRMFSRIVTDDIEIHYDLGTPLWLISADQSQIEQILANLIVNARDALPNGGSISIQTNNASIENSDKLSIHNIAPGQFVKISILDNGTGMEEEVLSHIFEPFYTTKEKGRGTGFGLATVFGIVKQLNGFIDVSSKYGVGTRFDIYLPKAGENGLPHSSKSDLTKKANDTKLILIVEDDDAVRSIVYNTLRKQGYEVIQTASPFEAIDKVYSGAYDFDLVITDIVMPGMNGREMSKQMLKYNKNMNFVYMSGYVENESLVQDIHQNRIPFLQKPFRPKDLIECVNEVFA